MLAFLLYSFSKSFQSLFSSVSYITGSLCIIFLLLLLLFLGAFTSLIL